MIEELIQGPFCGEIPLLSEYKNLKNESFYYTYHVCGDGSMLWIKTAFFKTKEEAIAAWNKRTDNKPHD